MDGIVGSDASVYQREFQSLSSVKTFHTSGRFGHPRDVSLLFSDNPDETEEYTRGIMAAAILIILLFGMWGGFLLAFKYMGPVRVGCFFSGHPYQQRGKAAKYGRIVFAVSSFFVLLFTILLVQKGISGLDTTTTTIRVQSVELNSLQLDLVGILDELQISTSLALPIRDDLLQFLKKKGCPSTLLSSTNMTIQQILQISEATVAAMKAVGDDVVSQLEEVDMAVSQVGGITNDVDVAMDSLDNISSKAALVMIPLYITTTFMVLALVFGWKDYYNKRFYCFIDYCVLPVFMFMLMITSVACGSAVLALQGNSDFCSGGTTNTPEGTIQKLLWQFNVFDGVAHDAAIFYSSQCRSTSEPFSFIEELQVDLVQSKESLADIFRSIEALSDELLRGCNTINVDQALEDVDRLEELLSDLITNVDGSTRLLSCSRIVPIYTSVVYDAACEYSIVAETWAFVSLFLVSFFGLMMIMFRSAYYPIDAYYAEKKRELEEIQEMEVASQNTGSNISQAEAWEGTSVGNISMRANTELDRSDSSTPMIGEESSCQSDSNQNRASLASLFPSSSEEGADFGQKTSDTCDEDDQGSSIASDQSQDIVLLLLLSGPALLVVVTIDR